MTSPLIQKLDEIEAAAKAVYDGKHSCGYFHVDVRPAELLALTQSLRLALDALNTLKVAVNDKQPDPGATLFISKTLTSITQLGLGEGGMNAVLKYKFFVDHTANGTEEYFSEKPTLSIAEVVSMIPGQSPFYNTFLKVPGKEDEQLFPSSAIDLRNDPHIYFTPPCTDRPGRSR